MNATPLQRYALRLLFAARQCAMIHFRAWKELNRKDAENMLAPFGGQEKIIRETVLPKKAPEVKELPEEKDSDAPAIAARTQDAGLEL